ncbi:MAG: signal peptidase II [Simkaniaceae bacterium]|nr:signal peptidase II [Simkaniaceae bacterium]
MRLLRDRYKLFLVLLFCAMIAIDALIKYYAYNFLTSMDWLHPTYPYGGVGVFENFFGINFSLNYVENRGGAWGLFAELHEVLLAVRIGIISLIGVYLIYFNNDPSRRLPFTLVLAGAIANVFDCFFYGFVVDMFHFVFWGYSFAVFNWADVSIFFGVLILVLQSMFKKPSSEPMQFNSNFYQR